jgi:hypothetical protein
MEFSVVRTDAITFFTAEKTESGLKLKSSETKALTKKQKKSIVRG